MRVIILLTSLFFICAIKTFAQPAILDQKSYGGNKFDQSVSLLKSFDGSFIVGTNSVSDISGEKSENSRGGEDFWVIKTSNTGVKLFDKTFGGTGVDQIRTILQLSSGDLLICGTSFSPVSGDKTAPQFGSFDYWVIRTDASGNKLWDKTYGGTEYDELYGAVLTADGNIFLGGQSFSGVSGNKTSALKGQNDYWLVKINLNGDIMWDKSYGTTSFDFMTDILPTPEGGAILGGHSDGTAEFDKSENSNGGIDTWMIKVSATGTKIWDKTIGGPANEQFQKMIYSPDSGLIVATSSESNAGGNKTENSRGTWDMWLIKLNASGNIVWNKTYGGSGEDFSRNLSATPDGKFLIVGYSSSTVSGDKSEPGRGGIDYWLLKLQADGSLIWDKTIGGSRDDYGTNVLALSNYQFILTGTSSSGKTGDKITFSRGNVDLWSCLLSEEPLLKTKKYKPNPMSGLNYSSF